MKMTDETTFVIQYKNIDGEEKELRLEAISAPEAAEMAESEDPDLGEMLFVGTEKEYLIHKASVKRQEAKKHQFENSFSI